jgi:hypothetical protein
MKIGVPEARSVRPTYRIIAGVGLSASQMHCALVGAEGALKKNKAVNRRFWEEWNSAHPTLLGPLDMPINVIGGHRRH